MVIHYRSCQAAQQQSVQPWSMRICLMRKHKDSGEELENINQFLQLFIQSTVYTKEKKEQNNPTQYFWL